MMKYLKVRKRRCHDCGETGEVVVKGFLKDRKEDPTNEEVVSYHCLNCGRQKKIDRHQI